MGWAEAVDCVRMTRTDIISYGLYGKRVLHCREDQFYLKSQRCSDSKSTY